MRPLFRRSLALACLLTLCSAVPSVLPAAEAPENDDESLRSLTYLPPDAVWAMASRLENVGVSYDGLLKLVGEFAPEGEAEAMLEPLRAWESKMGLSLRDDLLGLLGGEIAVAVGVDDLDQIGMSVMSAAQGADIQPADIFGGLVAVAGVKDPDHLDRTIRRLVSSVGGRLEEDGQTRRLHFVHEGRDIAALHYRYHGEFAVFAFGDGPLTDAILRSETGPGLSSTPEFEKVFAHLGPDPDSVAFMNLPRIRRLLVDSNLVRMALAEEPEIESYFQRFVVDTDWHAGVGWASYSVEGGSVQQSFAPFGMGTFTSSYLGIAAAVAIPNFLQAMDQGKQKRTVTDIEQLGQALEAYAADTGAYPPGAADPTPVSEFGALQQALVPNYLPQMPAVDGWGNPILYRSDPDGVTYLISSYGKDGEPNPGQEGEVIAGFEADIHFANGIFLAGGRDQD